MQVNTEQHDSTLVITMDDGKKNAITHDALQNLAAALDQAEQSEAVVVLAGRPGSFCAGFDISVLRSGDQVAFGRLASAGAELLLRLYSFPGPVISACTGHAFTIGALWLLASDYRIGTNGAFKIGMNETRLGQGFPDWALEPLRAQINPQQLESVVLHSKIFSPEGAIQAGFLHEVVDETQVMDRALAVAAEFAELPRSAFRRTKNTLRGASVELMTKSVEEHRQSFQ